MSKKANSTMIGLFTLLGLLLGAVSVVLFGAGKYFERTHKIQLYFDKSVNGLEVGSDVRFGGVRVGQVSSISVIVDTRENRKILPVVVELTDKGLRGVSGSGDESGLDLASPEGVRQAVRQGLRAGMKQQSLVTGKLYIEFDIVQEAKGFTFMETPEPEHPVVPTIPTEMDELISGISDGLKKINELDLAGLIAETRDVVHAAKEQIEQMEFKEINDNLTEITRDVREITADGRIKDSIENLDGALKEIRELSAKANENMDPLLADIRDLTQKTRDSLARIEESAESISQSVDPRSPTLLELQTLLRETENASRTLRELTSDLKRNPASLLRNKDNR